MNRNALIGCVGIAWSLLMLGVLIPLGTTMPDDIKIAALSPVFWPRIVVSFAAIASAFLLVQGIMERKSQLSVQDDQDDGYYPLQKAITRIVIVFALILGTYWSIDSLGLVIPSILTLGILMFLAGETSMVKIVLISILTPVILFSFFQYVANVPIPLGELYYIVFPD